MGITQGLYSLLPGATSKFWAARFEVWGSRWRVQGVGFGSRLQGLGLWVDVFLRSLCSSCLGSWGLP